MGTSEDQNSDRSVIGVIGDNVQYQFNQNIAGKFGSTTESAAKEIDKLTGHSIDETTARKVIPFAVGGLTAYVGMLLLEPMHKVTKLTFKAGKTLVTGFGYFEKIPLIGGLFTGLGKGVEALGHYAGYVVPAIAGVIGYKLFEYQGPAIAESAKTPLHHTGRTPKEVQNVKAKVVNPVSGDIMAQTDVPIAPASTAELSPDKKKLLEGAGINTPQDAKKLRESTLKVDSPEMKQLDSALENYLGNYNQNYENTREWINKARQYRDAGPRDQLMNALKKLGFSKEEAEKIVPLPPDLQQTIYKNGTDFPPELTSFIKKFEQTYGQGGTTVKTVSGEQVFTFVDKAGQTPRRKSWDEMSITQREEFLAKAIAFTQERFKFFEGRRALAVYSGGGGSMGGGMGASTAMEHYDYQNREPKSGDGLFIGISDWWNNVGPGESYGIKWSDEHKFIKEVYDVKSKIGWFGNIGIEVGSKFDKGVLDKWREQQLNSDGHKHVLDQAKGQIAEFGDKVKHMQGQLEEIKLGKLQASLVHQTEQEKSIVVIGGDDVPNIQTGALSKPAPTPESQPNGKKSDYIILGTEG